MSDADRDGRLSAEEWANWANSNYELSQMLGHYDGGLGGPMSAFLKSGCGWTGRPPTCSVQ